MFGLEASRTNHRLVNDGGVEDWIEACPLFGGVLTGLQLPVITAWSEIPAGDGVRYVPAPVPTVRIRRVAADGEERERHYLDALLGPGVAVILAVCQ